MQLLIKLGYNLFEIAANTLGKGQVINGHVLCRKSFLD